MKRLMLVASAIGGIPALWSFFVGMKPYGRVIATGRPA